MEYSLSHHQVTVICTIMLPLLIIYFIYYHLKSPTNCSKTKQCTVPQAGGAWPIIGHLHLFGSQQLTHKTLGSMADKYGPVFTIKLGSQRVLVLNGIEMAKECFTVHDKVFCSRPSVAASKLLGYDSAMFGFAPCGDYWREVRKIATFELLSNHRLGKLKHIRASEVKTMSKELYKLWVGKRSEGGGVLVDMMKWFGDLTHNISLRMIGGKRYFGVDAEFEDKETRRCKKLMRDFVYLFSMFVLSDAIPSLGWLDVNGYEKAMKKTSKDLDILIGEWLEDHKLKRLIGGGGEEEQDFMDVMLSILDDSKSLSGFDADTIIKATCLNLLVGGSDSIMVSITWALSLLLNNPQSLKKAQDELDMVVGKHRRVDESDIKNLIYLQAIAKETLRLYPPNPIIGHRAAMEDCTLSSGRYLVQAGTRLMVNVWKVQRDERVWPNPDHFQPERFLTINRQMDVRGKDFELIPFGSGRRSCPGISMSLQVMHLALASFLHSFEVSKPVFNKDLDMTESSGLTNLRATPLEVFVTPRLSSNLYEH